MTDKAAKNILDMAAKEKEGSFKLARKRDVLSLGLGNLEHPFKLARKRDVLSLGLGNPEHPGHVRGISSRLGWKE